MQPMSGIRIIEATTNAAGPMATGMLADQGAEVIRWEARGSGDNSRHVGGRRGGVGAYTAYMNRNKHSMAVDLRNAALRPWLLELVRTADVFVQNARPGALARSGFGYEDLRVVNPDLIYVSISGFGASGPAAHQRVYDPVIQCVSGFTDVQGDGDTPALMKTIASDKVTALTAAQAISAALLARARGIAGGHHVELSMLDASLAFLWPEAYWNHSFAGDEPFETRPAIADFYRLLSTRDGHITLTVVGDEEWYGACRALGLQAIQDEARFRTLSDRFANFAELCDLLEAAMQALDADEVVRRMDREGVPCAKVNRLAEVFDDPRVTHRASIVEYDHPDAGRLRQARAPAIFDGQPCPVRSGSPRLGQHTAELLGSVGCPAEDISALRAAGAID